MAIDALLARSADCSSATTFTLTGPKNYGDEAADYVDEIDLHGRLPFDQTFALVANVGRENLYLID